MGLSAFGLRKSHSSKQINDRRSQLSSTQGIQANSFGESRRVALEREAVFEVAQEREVLNV